MHARRKLWMLAVVTFGLLESVARAEVRLPKILSDHAVLQRGEPIRIWGWADSEEKVTVRFHGQERSAIADGLGKWSLWLAPEPAGGPYSLSVQGSSPIATFEGGPIILTDILVGDVWLASGQSNMQMPLVGFPGISAYVKNGQQELEHANLPRVRLLRVERVNSYFPVNDISSTWTECTKQSVANFSAIAYFFARTISVQEHVPVGIIDASWGGTHLRSWISMDRIGSDAGLMPIFAQWSQLANSLADRDLVLGKEKREDTAAEQAGTLKQEHPWHQQGRQPSRLVFITE